MAARPPKSPRVQPAGSGDNIGILLDMSEKLGTVAGEVRQMGGRFDEVSAGLQHVGDTMEQFSRDNSADHKITAEQLGAINARLAEGDRRLDDHAKRLQRLEEKRNGDKGPSKLESAIKFARENGAWIMAGGAFLWGMIWAYLKGGQPKP